ncbi:MAG: hypothetical protein ABFR19_04185 [Pseudomonadota bacterium]
MSIATLSLTSNIPAPTPISLTLLHAEWGKSGKLGALLRRIAEKYKGVHIALMKAGSIGPLGSADKSPCGFYYVMSDADRYQQVTREGVSSLCSQICEQSIPSIDEIDAATDYVRDDMAEIFMHSIGTSEVLEVARSAGMTLTGSTNDANDGALVIRFNVEYGTSSADLTLNTRSGEINTNGTRFGEYQYPEQVQGALLSVMSGMISF